MDPIKLNKLLVSLVKNREMQSNIVQRHSLELTTFRDYAEKLGAPTVEAEDKNTKYDY